MDIKTINFEVVPHLQEILFPYLLIGEEVWYRYEEDGSPVRVNKENPPGSPGHKPNEQVDRKPNDILRRAQGYFELSYFTDAQLEFIFVQLDKAKARFLRLEPETFFSYGYNRRHEYPQFENEIKARINAISENYEILKRSLLKNSKPKLSVEDHSRTKKFISERIDDVHNSGWEYFFTSESDFNAFTDLLTAYFEHREYTLPDTTIRLKRNCKTKLGKILGEIHKDLSEVALKSDTRFFEIVRTLNHFENEKDLYKVFTR